MNKDDYVWMEAVINYEDDGDQRSKKGINKKMDIKHMKKIRWREKRRIC